jgi:pimeloyl-ACP methyl ester carboxylesterase
LATVDRLEHASGNMEFVAEQAAIALSHATRKNKPDVVAAVREMSLSATPAALATAYRAIGARPDMRDALLASSLPLVLIAGADDPLMRIEEAQKLAESAPRAKFTAAPDAGHFSPIENPEVVTTALRDFWNAVSSSTAVPPS